MGYNFDCLQKHLKKLNTALGLKETLGNSVNTNLMGISYGKQIRQIYMDGSYNPCSTCLGEKG